MNEEPQVQMIGHVDHGKTTLTASIFSTPEFEQLRKRVHEELGKPYSDLTMAELRAYQNPPRAEHRGGKAARKMKRQRRQNR